MPSGSGARNLIILAGLGLLALLITGAIMGVIGQKILTGGDGYVSKPEITSLLNPYSQQQFVTNV